MQELVDNLVNLLDDMAALGDNKSAHILSNLMGELAAASGYRTLAISLRLSGDIFRAQDYEAKADEIFNRISNTELV